MQNNLLITPSLFAINTYLRFGEGEGSEGEGGGGGGGRGVEMIRYRLQPLPAATNQSAGQHVHSALLSSKCQTVPGKLLAIRTPLRYQGKQSSWADPSEPVARTLHTTHYTLSHHTAGCLRHGVHLSTLLYLRHGVHLSTLLYLRHGVHLSTLLYLRHGVHLSTLLYLRHGVHLSTLPAV